MKLQGIEMWPLVFLAIIGLILVAAHWPDDGMPYYASIEEAHTKMCIQTKGNHLWHASSGMSIEMYCKIEGTLKAEEAYCGQNPASC